MPEPHRLRNGAPAGSEIPFCLLPKSRDAGNIFLGTFQAQINPCLRVAVPEPAGAPPLADELEPNRLRPSSSTEFGPRVLRARGGTIESKMPPSLGGSMANLFCGSWRSETPWCQKLVPQLNFGGSACPVCLGPGLGAPLLIGAGTREWKLRFLFIRGANGALDDMFLVSRCSLLENSER